MSAATATSHTSKSLSVTRQDRTLDRRSIADLLSAAAVSDLDELLRDDITDTQVIAVQEDLHRHICKLLTGAGNNPRAQTV